MSFSVGIMCSLLLSMLKSRIAGLYPCLSEKLPAPFLQLLYDPCLPACVQGSVPHRTPLTGVNISGFSCQLSGGEKGPGAVMGRGRCAWNQVSHTWRQAGRHSAVSEHWS